MNYINLLVLLFFSVNALGQESFKKTYRIPQTIELERNEIVLLKREDQRKYEDLSQIEKDSIKRVFKMGDAIEYTVEKVISGNKVLVVEKRLIDEHFYQEQKIKKIIPATICSGTKGYVKFDGNKVYVNPYLRVNNEGNFNERDTYYYELKNRQAIRLKFTEWTVSALTIPIKYRFEEASEGISEEFTTSANANLFIGRAFCGRTSFLHRDKVGNISNTWKFTAGLLLGAQR